MTPDEQQIDIATCAIRCAISDLREKGVPEAAIQIAMQRVKVKHDGQ